MVHTCLYTLHTFIHMHVQYKLLLARTNKTKFKADGKEWNVDLLKMRMKKAKKLEKKNEEKNKQKK